MLVSFELRDLTGHQSSPFSSWPSGRSLQHRLERPRIERVSLSVLAPTSKALVTSSEALVPNSFLLLPVRHLLLEAMHLLLVASCS